MSSANKQTALTMAHNKDRRHAYPMKDEDDKQQKKHSTSWQWVLIVVLLAAPLLRLLIPDILNDYRLHRNNIETTAHVKELYKSGRGHNIKCVSYTYCVDNEWFNGHTSPPDSIWDNLRPNDPFEIVYEKGNPSNSNWSGYYKK